MIRSKQGTVQADSKGRVTLGKQFANRTVIIQSLDETAVTVTLARVIPEREAWLYDNPGAKQAVSEGIEQARKGELSAGPDMDAADALLAQIESGGDPDDAVQGQLDSASDRGIHKASAGGRRRPRRPKTVR